MNGTRLTDPDERFSEAAAWFARMRGPEAEASRADFEAWLASDDARRRAYNRASEVFALGKLLRPKAGSRLAVARGRRRPATAAALLAAGLAGLAWLDLRPGSPARQDLGAAPVQVAKLAAGAERTTFSLADGTLIRLERGSLLAVRFDNRARRLVLEAGAARFKVAHQSRPFIVMAGGGSVTAHGTMFDVALLGQGKVTVRLIEGSIDVAFPEPRQKRRQPPHRLSEGETVIFAAAASPGLPESDHAMNAPDGAREFDRISLAELVEIANQGSSRPILIEDPQIGRRRVSGRFRVDDTEMLAARLAALFNLDADVHDAAEIRLRRKTS